jgi:hypothetical protein
MSGGDAAAGSNAVGGPINLLGGIGDGTGGGGNVTLATGMGGALGSGGTLSLLTAPAAGGSGGNGGDILIQAALGDGAGDAGSIYIFGDGAVAGTVVSPGGDVQMIGATDPGNAAGGAFIADGGSPSLGGIATMRGGDAAAGSGLVGGSCIVLAGDGDGVGTGGSTTLTGGPGGVAGDGGDISVRGGAATGAANVGGDVRVVPGVGFGGAGSIRLEGRIDPAVGGGVAGIQFGTVVFPGPVPAAAAVGFNVAFGAAPTTVQLSIEASAAGLGGAGNDITYTIAPGSIGMVGFTVNFVSVGGIPGPVTLHWLALR